MRLAEDVKLEFLELVRLGYTLKDAAKAVGTNYQQIKYEKKKSSVFDRWVKEAQEEGKVALADAALTGIIRIAFEENPKDKRAQLTALMSLANYSVPGFRGESKRTVEHTGNVRVTGGPPRPKYKELGEPTMEIIDVTAKEVPEKKKRGRPKKNTNVIEPVAKKVEILPPEENSNNDKKDYEVSVKVNIEPIESKPEDAFILQKMEANLNEEKQKWIDRLKKIIENYPEGVLKMNDFSELAKFTGVDISEIKTTTIDETVEIIFKHLTGEEIKGKNKNRGVTRTKKYFRQLVKAIEKHC